MSSLHQELGPSFEHHLHGVIGPSQYDLAKLIGYTLGKQFNVLQVIKGISIHVIYYTTYRKYMRYIPSIVQMQYMVYNECIS